MTAILASAYADRGSPQIEGFAEIYDATQSWFWLPTEREQIEFAHCAHLKQSPEYLEVPEPVFSHLVASELPQRYLVFLLWRKRPTAHRHRSWWTISMVLFTSILYRYKSNLRKVWLSKISSRQSSFNYYQTNYQFSTSKTFTHHNLEATSPQCLTSKLPLTIMWSWMAQC